MYHWKEEVLSDSVSGVTFVLITSALVAWLCGVIAACGWDSYGAKPSKR